MKKLTVLLFLIFALTAQALAQANENPLNVCRVVRNEIEDCLKHYFAAGDTANPEELSKAFYPGAIMFWAAANGEANYLTQRRWKAVLKENKNPVKASGRDIQIIDCLKEICVAKIVSTFPDKVFYDYMAMVKTVGGWQIVGKIYLRREPDAAPVHLRSEEKRQIESLLNTKFKAMDSNDPDLLASAYYPRAMSYVAEENQLVGTSVGEWIARFAFDRKHNAPIAGAVRKIQRIDAAGSVGYAKFTHETSIRIVTDYALLLKTENRWRIICLLYNGENKK